MKDKFQEKKQFLKVQKLRDIKCIDNFEENTNNLNENNKDFEENIIDQDYILHMQLADFLNNISNPFVEK